MKKLQYIYGIITVVLVCMGVIFKIQHWAGAGIMLTLGIAALLLLFLPMALINNYKHEGNRQNLILYIVTYLTVFVVMGGALFKIQHWPGASIFIFIGLPFPFVVFLPVYLYVTSKIENFDLNKTVFVLFMMAYVSVFSVLLALNVSRNVLDSTLSMATSLHNMQPGLKQLAVSEGANNQAMQGSASALLKVVDDCRSRIYQATGTSQEDLKMGLYGVKGKDSQNVAAEALVMPEGVSPADALRKAMEDYKTTIAAANPSPELKGMADKLLNTADYNKDGVSMEWEAATFYSHHLTWILSYLESIEDNVYLLETIATQK
jgi:hypothetical protein